VTELPPAAGGASAALPGGIPGICAATEFTETTKNNKTRIVIRSIVISIGGEPGEIPRF